MRASLTRAVGLVVVGLLATSPALAGKKRQQRQAVLDQIAPWASDPDGVKLEIVERLVLETRQYDKALPIIAAMRQEGLDAPILDLVQGIAMREQGMRDEAETLLLSARKRLPSWTRASEGSRLRAVRRHPAPRRRHRRL